ncbi:MAG: hypothetical protein ACK5ZJ_00685, partial [Acidobacteriota bacterium]
DPVNANDPEGLSPYMFSVTGTSHLPRALDVTCLIPQNGPYPSTGWGYAGFELHRARCRFTDPMDAVVMRAQEGEGSRGGGSKPECPEIPDLPWISGEEQIDQSIAEANAVFNAALAAQRSNPDPSGSPGTVGATAVLLDFLYNQFKVGGAWDFKNDKQSTPETQKQARIFGNIHFGAVLEGLGFSLQFSQSVAGAYQMVICNVLHGACGDGGIPFLNPPFGDQFVDQADIRRGWDYRRAVRRGCR